MNVTKYKANGVNMEREHIVYQILDKDNWQVIDEIDSFLFIYDRMPTQMKVVVDYKMTGESNQRIAEMLGIPPNQVRAQLSKAKKRILNALY